MSTLDGGSADYPAKVNELGEVYGFDTPTNRFLLWTSILATPVDLVHAVGSAPPTDTGYLMELVPSGATVDIVRWNTMTGERVDLATVPVANSIQANVNDRGQVVFGYRSPNSDGRIRFWDEHVGVLDLATGALASPGTFGDAGFVVYPVDPFGAILRFISVALAPGPPGDPHAALVHGTPTMTWDAPDFEGGASVSGFRVYRNDEPIGETDAKARAFTDTQPPEGSVSYAVVALNVFGESRPAMAPESILIAAPQISPASAVRASPSFTG
jgi:hypothetical protein